MPADHPLAGPLAELSGRYYRIEQLTEFTPATHYDESLMTADLDELVESGESPAVISRVIASEQPWVRSLALELHRTRRFYERPEEQANGNSETPGSSRCLCRFRAPSPSSTSAARWLGIIQRFCGSSGS